MSRPYYLTTPLYYVNAKPHIGHAYTTVAADALARYHRLMGDEVYFLTGTDEHGQKIAQAAQAQGQAPKAYADQVVQDFQRLWERLSICCDRFIRTTDADHEATVQAVLQQLYDTKQLVAQQVSGWYCTPCETFWTDEELSAPAAGGAPACSTCSRPVERVTEDGWYLPLRQHQPWLREWLRAHPQAIQPPSRYNEVLGMLEQPIPEYLCITRPKSRVSWGIAVPFSDAHVVYVWFDALVNYITACDYRTRGERPSTRSARSGQSRATVEGRWRLWPASVHLIGKDILRFHAVYWPIMLHALGVEPPQTIFAHGWWKVGQEKMSKSKGNVVDPLAVIDRFGPDAFRYFLLREIPFGQDGVFSEEAVVLRLNADLANDVGNLLNRTLTMIEKYFQGRVPQAAGVDCDDELMRALAQRLPSAIAEGVAAFDFAAALSATLALVSRANKYIEEQAPWKLFKEGQTQRLATMLYNLAEVLRITTVTLWPAMPRAAEEMWKQLGRDDRLDAQRLATLAAWGQTPVGQQVRKGAVLFPRVETK